MPQLREAVPHGLRLPPVFQCLRPAAALRCIRNVIPIFAHQVLHGETLTIFGDGEQTRDFVNVEDVAQANVRAALTPDLSGAFNLGSGTRISINDLVALLERVSGLRPAVRYGPPRRRRP